MIFGWGFVILAAIIIIYIVIQRTRSINESNQIPSKVMMSNKDELNANNDGEENSEKANFCYTCGDKLDGNQLKYCPRCGSKV